MYCMLVASEPSFMSCTLCCTECGAIWIVFALSRNEPQLRCRRTFCSNVSGQWRAVDVLVPFINSVERERHDSMIQHCRAVDDRLYDRPMSLCLAQGAFVARPITLLPPICLLLGLPSSCQLKWAKLNSQPTMNFGHLLPHPSLSPNQSSREAAGGVQKIGMEHVR